MTQTALVITALKQLLKQRGLTYAHVASVLEISEASVKRLFAEQNFTIERLEKICQSVDIGLSDLFKLIEHPAQALNSLTEQQESILVSDPKLLLIIYLVLNDWCMADICKDYQIEYHECIQLLAKLDKVGLIELQPKNRIKLKISSHIQWQPNGPIAQYFQQQIKDEFLQESQLHDSENFKFLPAMLSNSSIKLLEKKLKLLTREFNELVKMDAQLPKEERHGFSLLIAMRQWEFSVFRRYRRQPNVSNE